MLFQATSVNAEMLNCGHELGLIAEDALADLIAVDGDPLEARNDQYPACSESKPVVLFWKMLSLR